jgi:hypothetical protein
MRGDQPAGDEQPDLEGPAPSPPDQSGGPSARTLLVAAVVMVALGYFLVIKLRDMSRLQECVMSGRTNCAPIADGGR